jgi:hypothetical protein
VYAPGVAFVFPADSVATWDDVTKFEDSEHLVAIVDLPSALPGNNWVNLNPGINCLYLRHTPGSPAGKGWAGTVADVDENSLCPKVGTRLVAQTDAEQFGYTSASDFPPVARFVIDHQKDDGDADSKTKGIVIGVRCGNAWCELGAKNVKKAPNDAAGGKADKIKGYHSLQDLALGSGVKVKRSHTRIIVTPELNPPVDWKADQAFHTVAYIQVVDKSGTFAGSKYETKWGMNGNKKVTQLQLARDVSGNWTAQLVNPDLGQPVALNVWREQHSARVAPVARWLWALTDDAVWVACDDGCCTVNNIS